MQRTPSLKRTGVLLPVLFACILLAACHQAERSAAQTLHRRCLDETQAALNLDAPLPQALAATDNALRVCEQAHLAPRNPQAATLEPRLRALRERQTQLRELIVIEGLMVKGDFEHAAQTLESARAHLPPEIFTRWTRILTTLQAEETQRAIEHERAEQERKIVALPVFARSLHERYRSRITFLSERAEARVLGFHLGCSMPDGRYVPLINLLYAKLKSIDANHSWLTLWAEQRGQETRIYEQLMGPKGALTETHLAFTLTAWDELIPHGVSSDAVLTAGCLGAEGKTYVVPTKQT